MQKVLVILNIQTLIEADTDEEYQEALFDMIEDLEERGFTVNIENEEEDEDGDGEYEDTYDGELD